MGLCYLLIPQWDYKFQGEMGECVLPAGHMGNHLNRLDSGNYLSWGGDGCDDNCDWCGECFCWIEIPSEEASAIIAGTKENYNF